MVRCMPSEVRAFVATVVTKFGGKRPPPSSANSPSSQRLTEKATYSCVGLLNFDKLIFTFSCLDVYLSRPMSSSVLGHCKK